MVCLSAPSPAANDAARALGVDHPVELAIVHIHALEVGGFIAVADALAAHRQSIRAAIGLIVGLLPSGWPQRWQFSGHSSAIDSMHLRAYDLAVAIL